MWRVRLSQAEWFQRGLPGGSRAADIMSFVLKSQCLLNLNLNQLQPCRTQCHHHILFCCTIHSHVSQAWTHTHTHISNHSKTMAHAYIQVKRVTDLLLKYNETMNCYRFYLYFEFVYIFIYSAFICSHTLVIIFFLFLYVCLFYYYFILFYFILFYFILFYFNLI